MAIIKCPECGNGVSSYAEACPSCGCPKSLLSAEIEYERARELFDSDSLEKLKSAKEAFEKLGSFKDSDRLAKSAVSKIASLEQDEKYQRACRYIEHGSWQNLLLGMSLLREMGDYRDSRELMKKANNDAKSVVGGYVSFGCYKGEPLEWRVLAVKNESSLLITSTIIDCVPYNNELERVTWESCSLRRWLNGAFLEMAFNDEERALIVPTSIPNPDNPNPDPSLFGDIVDSPTIDRVFCLSWKEAARYFGRDIPRRASHGGCSSWWLRSPKNIYGLPDKETGVIPFDGILGGNARVNRTDEGVRPAIWLKLES